MIREEDFYTKVDDLLQQVENNMRVLFELRKGQTSLRELGRVCRISVAVLSTFFSDSGKNDKKNGLQCRNMLKLAKHLNVSLEDIFHVDQNPEEAQGRYSDDLNAWNVFIENAQRMIPYADAKKKLEDKDYVDANPQGNFQKYCQRLIGKGTQKTGFYEGIGELYGNPNCELITLIQVMIGLDFDLDLYKWFRRGSLAQKNDESLYIERYNPVPSDLYVDEVKKLKEMSKRILTEEYQTVIRVGSREEMKKYTCPQECHELIRLEDNKQMQGTVKDNYLYLTDWTPLYDEGKVKARDALLVTKSGAVSEEQSSDETYHVINLTKPEKKELYADHAFLRRMMSYYTLFLQTAFEKDSSREFVSKYFQTELVEANLDKKMDPLGLFIFNQEDASRRIKLSLDPAQYIANSEENRSRILDTFGTIGQGQPQQREVKTSKPKNTIRIVNYSGHYTHGLHLDWQTDLIPTVSLYKQNKARDYIISQAINEFYMEVMPKRKEEWITCWNKNMLLEAIWNKLLATLRSEGYDEKFILSYEKKAKRIKVLENLFRSNRLWLEIVIPNNESRKIHWYWNLKITAGDRK